MNPPEDAKPRLDWWQRLRLWWGEPPLPAGVNGPPPPGSRPKPPPAPPLIGGQGMPTPPGYSDGHGEPTPEPPASVKVEHGDYPGARASRPTFPMFDVHCAICSRIIRIPCVGNPGDIKDIVVPFLCDVCRKASKTNPKPSPEPTPTCPTCLALERISTTRPAPPCAACWAKTASNPPPDPPLCSGCGKPLDVLGTIQGTPVYGHCTLGGEWTHDCSLPKVKPPLGGWAVQCGRCRAWTTGGDAESVRAKIEQLLSTLERVPCMSEDCDGTEDGEPVSKDCPKPTRCHRCAAVRLARSVVRG